MQPIRDIEQLEEALSRPNSTVIETMRHLTGDVAILGVGGKMGPTLARMIKRASDEAGTPRRVIGVSRFSSSTLPDALQLHGIEPIAADLLDRAALAKLPDVENIVFMAGMKFGSSGHESHTWAMNCYLPGLVCERFPQSRIAAFSTGNIYGLVPVTTAGSRETDPPNPVGDYAMSCLGRERIFEHFNRTQGTPLSILRLNYAVELRYGVLVDIARKVWEGHPIDVTMGHANVIWQQEASAMSIAALQKCATPPYILNISGPEILRIRDVAEKFSRIFNKPAHITGTESADALLNDGSLGHAAFFRPTITPDDMITQIAAWISRGGPSLDKPTHFEARDGRF